MLERAVKITLEWFEYNYMRLNASKCHLLVCGHKFENMIAKIGNENIIETHSVKLLGMSIDSELTFGKHMDIICKTASILQVWKKNVRMLLCETICIKG